MGRGVSVSATQVVWVIIIGVFVLAPDLHTHQSPERLLGAQIPWLKGRLGHQVSAKLSINSSTSSLETLNRAAV
jgi:hypothetical protein